MKSNNKNWKEYFQDTTHKTLSFGPFFIRTLPITRRSAIEKEFHAQKYLSATGLVPRPYFKYLSTNSSVPSFVIEKNIDFFPVYQKNITFIKNVGRTLSILHNHSRTKSNQINITIPPDSLLVNGVYDPLVILKIFITDPLKKIKANEKKLVTFIVDKNLEIIEKRVRELSKKVKYKSEYNALIHGDLNDTNIVRKTKGDLVYLDWADCRWDIVTCDVSQFIYLHKLNEKEQKIFLQAYGASWITNEMIEIHRLLLVGWDIIYLMTVNLEIPEDKIERLLPIKVKIWDRKEVFI